MNKLLRHSLAALLVCAVVCAFARVSATSSSSSTVTPDPVASIVVGGVTSVGLRADGSAWGWGANTYGAVGDGTTTERRNPVPIGTGATLASAFGLHIWVQTVVVKGSEQSHQQSGDVDESTDAMANRWPVASPDVVDAASL
jgi:alpha-tubulin suppressor-like RCC1 family protein